MGFSMIDRIIRLESGERIEAVKTLSLCEDYLADHFPAFPVMPGVLMLEAMVQAAAWLLRLSGCDKGSLYIVREVRSIRYGSFVKPGDQLRVSVKLVDAQGDCFTFRGKGSVGGRNAVVGKFVLKQKPPGAIHTDLERMGEKLKLFYEERARSLMEYDRTL